jgi:hypothetical protein
LVERDIAERLLENDFPLVCQKERNARNRSGVDGLAENRS